MKTLTKYDILVVVLNRLYLVLVIGLHTRYGYSYLSTSRGAGNSRLSSSLSCKGGNLVQLPTYLARGRKLQNTFRNILFRNPVQLPIYLARGRKRSKFYNPRTFDFSIDTYLSREGPETSIFRFQLSSSACISPHQPREGPGTKTFSEFLSLIH